MDINGENELIAEASPAKNFFVNMLTRDIELKDAILDLIDNCVDGIMRDKKRNGINFKDEEQPYNGYYAEIQMTGEYFSITDNCGGIPLNIAKRYAFKMGRDEAYTEDDKDLPTVGMYGIGMKRAMFKMGRHSVVTSHTRNESFEVVISPEWLEEKKDWRIPIKLISNEGSRYGTKIETTYLHREISAWFSNHDFVKDFYKTVSRNFSFIISKGFKISINGSIVEPAPLSLLFDKDSIKPYIYEATIGNVEIFLQVGFCKRIAKDEEVESELKASRSKDESGWTIVCNDRVILYKDKTYVTGWGDTPVPHFHSQFIGITGVVQFYSSQPEHLPLTTTKRGIEELSPLYLEVKKYMKAGTKIFTDYTNVWKSKKEEEFEATKNATLLSIDQIKVEIPKDQFTKIKDEPSRKEFLFKPILPKPKERTSNVTISFQRSKEDVKKVSSFLFEDPNKPANMIGNACFDEILRRADDE
ncbi:ATP-binding protein [Paenibacillus sp. SYP-B4298]|uniref:ATP-binding protein n=1 Tax=Paenibacillus sp. SYP-B4298 TaxID=2996034 RepID=UPI0022DE7AF8|nr:ATP-binding protein [Paenibacillus sp. SYP-B4298]